MRGNGIILATVAKTLNIGGSAIVSAYDVGAGAFNTTMSALSPGEKSQLRGRIKAFEKKIQSLHGELGKVTSNYADPAEALESEAVVAIIGSIKELTHEIEVMKQRIIELEAEKTEQAKQALKNATIDPAGVASFFVKAISGSLASYLPGERRTLEHKIAEHEKKIQALYGDFAKESAKYSDPATALTAKPIKEVISKINELKGEIDALKEKLAELAVEKPVKAKSVATPAQDTVVAETAAEGSSTPLTFFAEAVAEVAVPESSAVAVTPQEKKQLPVRGEVAPMSNESSGLEYGYTRAKRCLAPPPALQPPTQEDIENVSRGLQVEKAESVGVAEVFESSAVEPQEVIAESVTVAEEASGSEAEPVAVANEAPLVTEEAPKNSEAEVVAEATPEQEAGAVVSEDSDADELTGIKEKISAIDNWLSEEPEADESVGKRIESYKEFNSEAALEGYLRKKKN